MGTPEHFSYDIPGRCLKLIDQLMSKVRETTIPGNEGAGPLTTTFLLAMATPMIILPVERIFLPTGHDDLEYADDTQINQNVTGEVKRVMGLKLRKAPFFHGQSWSYASRPLGTVKLADGLDDQLCVELNDAVAFKSAASMDTSQIVMCLRNSLAHGGVAYLNGNGFHAVNEPTKMLAFVSYKRKSGERVGVNILRIDEEGFLGFLRDWSRWLEDTGLAREIQLAA